MIAATPVVPSVWASRSRAAWAASSAWCVGLAAALEVIEADAFAAPRRPYQALLLAFTVAYAWMVRLGVRVGDARNAIALRGCQVLGVLLVTWPAAASPHELDPAWSLFAMLPVGWSVLFPRSRFVTWSILLVPPLVHLVAVEAASVRSTAIAAALGAGGAALHHALAVRHHVFLERVRRDREVATLGAPTVDEAGAWLCAMRLHDGLSGALLRATAELRAAAGDAERLAVAVRALERLRATLAMLAGGDAVRGWSAFAGHMRTVGRDLGMSVDARLEGPEPGPSGAWVHAAEMATEILANEARHAGARRASIVGAVRRGRLELTVAGGSHAAAGSGSGGGGRGLRNLHRRALALGGGLARSDAGTHHVVIPLGRDVREHLTTWAPSCALVVLAGAIPLAVTSTPGLLSFLALAHGIIAIVIAVNGVVAIARRAARRSALADAVTRAGAGARDLAIASLAPLAAELASRIEARDAASAARVVAAANGALGRLLDACEAPPLTAPATPAASP